MSHPIQLTPRIYLVGSGEIGLSEEHDAHIYLVDAGTCSWLVDAGTGIEPGSLIASLEYLDLRDRPVTHLLLTHCHADHAGGAAYLQEKLGLEIVSGVLTAERVRRGAEQDLSLDAAKAEGIYPAGYIFTPPARVDSYASDAELDLGDTHLIVLSTPGHSADSVCFLAETPDGPALFAGDTLFANGLLPMLNTFDSELSDYRQTIRMLADLSFDMLFPGHGLFMLRDGQGLAQKVVEKLTRSIYVPPMITPS